MWGLEFVEFVAMRYRKLGVVYNGGYMRIRNRRLDAGSVAHGSRYRIHCSRLLKMYT